MRRSCVVLAMLIAALVASPGTAAAGVAPGLSGADASAIYGMAKSHWPGLACDGVVVTAAAPARMRGLRVGMDPQRRCALMVNRGVRMTATAWCRALAPAFATLARGSRPSAWPYDCALAVGPRPTRPHLVAVPGLSAAAARRAYQVASAHWPRSGCRGREQLRWATPALLAAGSGDDHGPGIVTMGLAGLRDPRCVIFLNSAFTPWTPTMLCHVIEHEAGHLTGLGHDPRIDPVMTAVGGHAADCEAAFGADDAPPEAPLETTVAAPGGFGGFG